MASNRTFILAVERVMLGALMVIAVVGLGVSSGCTTPAARCCSVTFVVLIALPFVHMARGTLPDYHPFSVAMPALSLFSLNIFGKMAVGGLSGFEYVAVLAGETKEPERTIGRAMIIAAPIIALMFILGTSAVLAFVPIDQIDLIGPIPQVLHDRDRLDRRRRRGGGGLHSAHHGPLDRQLEYPVHRRPRACRWSRAGTI